MTTGNAICNSRSSEYGVSWVIFDVRVLLKRWCSQDWWDSDKVDVWTPFLKTPYHFPSTYFAIRRETL